MVIILKFFWEATDQISIPCSQEPVDPGETLHTIFKNVKGFSGGSPVKESTCNGLSHRIHGLHPWVGKIPWRSKCQPTPVFLLGESHGQRSLVGTVYGAAESDMTKRLSIDNGGT